MAYLHCEFQYNTAIVKNVFDTVEAPSENIDFVTGNITITDRYYSEYYNYGTVNGTTLTASAVTNDTVLSVSDSSGMSVNERVSIELDNGLRHVTYVLSVDSGTQITIADGLTSASSSSNNVVVSSQLDGTTDGSLAEDFKFLKADEIQTHTVKLLQYGYDYSGKRFPLIGDTEPSLRVSILFMQYKTDRSSSNLTITNITQDNPAVVTVSSLESVETFDTIIISGVLGMTEVNGTPFVVGEISGSTFKLWEFPAYKNVDSTGFSAYTSGGTITKQDAAAFQPLLDSDGNAYAISNNSEFLEISQIIAGRRNYIFGSSGQTGLLNQISVANNTQAAMDAIVDSRT